ncbi:MAG TPA: RHS repeat-associated core domain-containing protein, partial [Opitutaceae bacterium]|nr:RHS repeat-associated core domain-containing protein [Opitutaceae bacterium]
MKKVLLLVACLAALRAPAMELEPPKLQVGISFLIAGYGNGQMTVQGEPGNQLTQFTNNTWTESGTATVFLRPGKNYSVTFQGWGPWAYTMSFLAPAGYEVHVDGYARDMYTNNTGGGDYTVYHTLRIVSKNEAAPAGSFSGIDVGRAVSWSVGLGNLHGGQGAGLIRFHEADLSYSSTPATRDRLMYAAPRNFGQAHAVYDGPSGQHLKQVLAAQTFVNLVDVTNGFRMDFYPVSAATWNGATYTVSGTVWKSITVESPAGTDLKVTESEGAVTRVSHLTLPGLGTAVGSGGAVTTENGYTVHTFTGSGTFTASAALTADVILVGGGGGGAAQHAGGGGAGGVVQASGVSVAATSHAVTVGGGGAGNPSSWPYVGTSGGNSSALGYTAYGGGAGNSDAAGLSGGSGGGAGYPDPALGGAGTAGQGYSGNTGSTGSAFNGGGGGGAGGPGNGATGGPPITTWAGTFAGGGGGGFGGGAGGGAGAGAGGSGANWGGHASANTGSGGGGGGNFGAGGGNGGSGIVKIRYPQAGTVGSGNYTWQLQEGDGTTWLRTTIHTSAIVTGGRDETVVVRTGGTSGTVVTKTRYEFRHPGSWGEELYRRVADPDGAALTTTYTYHTNSAALGHYRRIATVTHPDGNWRSYSYYDDWNRRGQVCIESGPWNDSPGTAQAAGTSVGHSIAYDWSPDFGGRYRMLMHRWEYVNGAMIRKFQSVYYAPHYTNAIPSYRHEADAYPDSSNYLRTYHFFAREDALPDIAGKSSFVRRPDETTSSSMWWYGTFNPTTKAFTATSSYPPDPYFREVTVHGGNYIAGGAFSSWDGTAMEGIWVHPNRSTAEVVIRDWAGNIVRRETHVCTGGTSFTLVTWEDFTYDVAGRLLSSVASNGATVTNTYTNGRLASTVGADGTETQFTYDELGRVKTSVRKGAAAMAAVVTAGYSYPAQGDVTTTYTYDGAGRVTQTVVSGGSLSQTSSAAYDLAGRLDNSTAPGGYYTDLAYASGGRVVTTTFPGGATRTAENYLDGRLKQVSGSAQVSEWHNYGIESGTNRVLHQVNPAHDANNWVNTFYDWMGRKREEWIPGWNGTATGRTWHYNSYGQVSKRVQPGLADTLYVYDAMGRMYRDGLDINANGALDLASDDRITESLQSFYWNGANWYLRTTGVVYATPGSATATETGTRYEKLTSLTSGILSQTEGLDINGNWTVTRVEVDRAAKKLLTRVDTPDSNIESISVAYNGLAVEARDTAGVTMRYEHDALGRPCKSIDPRTGATTTAFVAGTSQVYTVTDPASVVQATYAYDSAGRVFSVKDALNKYSYTTYTSRGEVHRQWGDTTYPVEYGYDNWGRRTTMSTYRGGSGWAASTWPGSPGTADTTTWAFHTPTGLLSSKTDAANKAITYTYTQARQMATRTWARGVSTTYGYSGTTGELTSVDYSDTTADLTYTYNRLGKNATVTDATGTRTFTYNLAGTLELQREDLPAFFGSRRLTYQYDTTGSGTKGRLTELFLGTNVNPTLDQGTGYTYGTDGRLTGVNANASGYSAPAFTYTYTNNSRLIASTVNTSLGYTDVRTYDPQRDWLDDRETKWGTTTKAKFAYAQDNLGRVSQLDKTGEVFSRYGNGTQGLKIAYGYDDRSQLTSEVTYLGGTSTVLTGRNDSAYAWDNLGNRSSVTHNGNAATYTANSRNQYSSRTVPGVFDVAGAAGSATTVTVNGSNAGVTRHGDYFFKGHGLGNAPNPVCTTLTISDGTTSTGLLAFLPGTPQAFTYDDDGNLTSDGRFTYTYDAENRLQLVGLTTAAANAGHVHTDILFAYDYLGRRIRKVGTLGGYSFENRFLYNGWNPIAEFWGAYNGGAFVSTYSRHHFWGLDLSGSLAGAGGVGGLLMVQEGGNSYLPAYDALGNVHGMIKASDGSLAAAYEYDAFGNTLRESGTYAASNPFRFATKYTDIETGLVQYNTRYYSPSLGRFINRDTIGEAGGLNLYAYVSNRVPNAYDYLGMDEVEYDVVEFNPGNTVYSGFGVGGTSETVPNLSTRRVRVTTTGPTITMNPFFVNSNASPSHDGIAAY